MVLSGFATVPMRVAQGCMLGLALSIPLSTALDNLLLALLLLTPWLAWKEILLTAQHNPVARVALLLFGALSIGVLYGQTPLGEALGWLGKYLDLAFIPLMMSAGRQPRIRERIELVFLAAMLVTAVLTWMVALHVILLQPWMWSNIALDNPAIFRSSITQNIMMAYATCLLVLRARDASAFWVRVVLTTAAMVAGSSVMFLVQGKTGYVVLPALLLYCAWVTLSRKLRARGRALGWKEGAAIILLGLAMVTGAYQASPRMHQKVEKAVHDFRAWNSKITDYTSTGERMEYYSNTLLLFLKHPLLGVGTGGFPAAYEQQALQGKQALRHDPGGDYIALVGGGQVLATNNPHNEYLLLASQIGIGGALLLVYLFYLQWRGAARLPDAFQQDAARGLVLTVAISALFNSPLHDHTEGLFFAFFTALWYADPGKEGGSA